MDDKPLRIVQISDMHLYADSKKELLGVNTEASFKQVIDLIRKNSQLPDAIILTGDLSQDYSPESYIKLTAMVKDIDCPVYYIPGNHDDIDVMAKILPRDNVTFAKNVIFNHWQFILLDSHQHAKVEGLLSADELNYMEECLKKHPNHHALVFFHHHPVSVGCHWIDNLGLQNAKEFWEIASNHSNFSAVLFGHVHQEYQGTHKNIKYFSAPSTCIQFKPNSYDFELDNIPQGYRWMELYLDGAIKTGIKRLAKYVGTFEKNAKGY